MIVIVTGSPGSGKSTLAERIAKHFRLHCVFASDILRRLQTAQPSEIDLDKTEKGAGFWESEEGKAYVKQRLEKGDFDKKLDDELLKIIRHDNVVVDSRTMPWLSKKGFKIWLEASPEVRASRIAGRDELEKEKVLQSMNERLEADKKIYKKLYGFDFGSDFKPFGLVLNTDNLSQDDVFEIVKTVLEKAFKTAD